MRNSKFLSALLLTISVSNVWGSDWQELPCKSEVIDNVKLEANSSSLRISSRGRVLGTETICEARHNLVEQMSMLVARQGGFYTITTNEPLLEIDYLPERRPLVGRVGGRAWQRFEKIFIGGMLYENLKGVGTSIIEEAKDTYRRGYGEVTGTIKDNVVWKVGIAQSSKQNQNDPK
jgi:hypothetical protein